MVTCILPVYTLGLWFSSTKIVALQLAQFKGFQKEVERIAGKWMRHPACPVVFSTQERPHLFPSE